MLYVKYVYPTGQENVTGPYELVSSEWIDEAGTHHQEPTNAPNEPPRFRVVYAYSKIALGESDIEPGQARGATMTYGPNITGQPTPEQYAEYEKQCSLHAQGQAEMPQPLPTMRPKGKVYVMTESGGTVAKYEI